jgi:hypothetical protein
MNLVVVMASNNQLPSWFTNILKNFKRDIKVKILTLGRSILFFPNGAQKIQGAINSLLKNYNLFKCAYN